MKPRRFLTKTVHLGKFVNVLASKPWDDLKIPSFNGIS